MENIKDLKVNLESKILASKNIIIVPHTRIDMDAFASAIGISLVVSKLQKSSSILIDDASYSIDNSVKKVIEDAKKQFTLSKDTILIELVDICSKSSNKDLNIDIVEYFEDVKDNQIAQAFIVDTVKKDIANLKQGFSKIYNNFKKGRK